jgi:hypothetical protein
MDLRVLEHKMLLLVLEDLTLDSVILFVLKNTMVHLGLQVGI